MITPKWVSMPTQPIAISNVLAYLKGCLEHLETRGRTFDIGGPDVYSYRELFKIFAQEAGIIRPVMIPVPVLTPRLSSLWINLVTPVPASIAKPLAEGLSIPTVCIENSIKQIIPQELISCRKAIRKALQRTLMEQVDHCRESDDFTVYPEWSIEGDAVHSGGTIFQMGYRTRLKGSPGDIWPFLERIGGKQGCYGGDTLWKILTLIHRISDGAPLVQGRTSKDHLEVGDSVDFWKVLEVFPPVRLLLESKMKLPGDALFEIRLEPFSNQEAELKLLSFFKPRGLPGIFYWYLLYPFHQWVFFQMSKGIIKESGLKHIAPPKQFIPELVTSCRLSHDGPGRKPS